MLTEMCFITVISCVCITDECVREREECIKNLRGDCNEICDDPENPKWISPPPPTIETISFVK